jgi:hypothetical protein
VGVKGLKLASAHRYDGNLVVRNRDSSGLCRHGDASNLAAILHDRDTIIELIAYKPPSGCDRSIVRACANWHACDCLRGLRVECLHAIGSLGWDKHQARIGKP